VCFALLLVNLISTDVIPDFSRFRVSQVSFQYNRVCKVSVIYFQFGVFLDFERADP
jgi:hypothetical protein